MKYSQTDGKLALNDNSKLIFIFEERMLESVINPWLPAVYWKYSGHGDCC